MRGPVLTDAAAEVRLHVLACFLGENLQVCEVICLYLGYYACRGKFVLSLHQVLEPCWSQSFET